MWLTRALLGSGLLLAASLAVAGQVTEGTYSQTWASPVAGQCTDCEVRIRRVTPHIVELTANNGWTGFAYYVPREDRYQGTFEWSAGEGGPYQRVLFSIDLKFDGQMLTMNASSSPLSFAATYKKKPTPPIAAYKKMPPDKTPTTLEPGEIEL